MFILYFQYCASANIIGSCKINCFSSLCLE